MTLVYYDQNTTKSLLYQNAQVVALNTAPRVAAIDAYIDAKYRNPIYGSIYKEF